MFSGLQTYVIVQLSIDLPVAMQNAMYYDDVGLCHFTVGDNV